MPRVTATSLLIFLVGSCAQTFTRSWYLPAQAKSIQVNGYDTSFVELGTGQPVVLVHGGLCDFRYFADPFSPRTLAPQFLEFGVTCRVSHAHVGSSLYLCSLVTLLIRRLTVE